MLCRDLHFTLMFSGHLLKDLFKGGRSLTKTFFQTKLFMSRLSHKVCRLSSPVLLRKFIAMWSSGYRIPFVP